MPFLFLCVRENFGQSWRSQFETRSAMKIDEPSLNQTRPPDSYLSRYRDPAARRRYMREFMRGYRKRKTEDAMRTFQTTDPVRKLIWERSAELRRPLSDISKAIGKSHAYLQQFL